MNSSTGWLQRTVRTPRIRWKEGASSIAALACASHRSASGRLHGSRRGNSADRRLPPDTRANHGAAAHEPISGAQLGQRNRKPWTRARSAVVGVAARRSVAVAGRIAARSLIRAIVCRIARRISVALLRVAGARVALLRVAGTRVALLRVAGAWVVLVRTTDDCK